MALLAGSPALLVAAEKVEFTDLPPAVQKTINAQAGASGIASIERTTRHGIPLYEVRLSQPGNARPLYISETGSVINLDHVVSSTAKEGSRKVKFSELPVAVQNTLRSQAGSSRIEDIDAVTRSGETTYNAAFKRDGKTAELWLDANGNILNQGNAASPAATPAPAPAGQRVPLAAASKVDPDDLPRAVRQTLQNYTQGARIEDVDKGTLQGQTVYEAAFKRNGQHIELRVNEDGTLIRDDANDRSLSQIGRATSTEGVGRPPSWQILTGGEASTSSQVSDLKPVPFNQLPATVQRTLRGQAGQSAIDTVRQGTLDGKTVYEAFYSKDGETRVLRVGKDGSLLR